MMVTYKPKTGETCQAKDPDISWSAVEILYGTEEGFALKWIACGAVFFANYKKTDIVFRPAPVESDCPYDLDIIGADRFYVRNGLRDAYNLRTHAVLRVLRRLHDLRGDWRPDWGDADQYKCAPELIHGDYDTIRVSVRARSQQLENYWYAPERAWGVVIEELNADVKLALWGIE